MYKNVINVFSIFTNAVDHMICQKACSTSCNTAQTEQYRESASTALALAIL